MLAGTFLASEKKYCRTFLAKSMKHPADTIITRVKKTLLNSITHNKL